MSNRNRTSVEVTKVINCINIYPTPATLLESSVKWLGIPNGSQFPRTEGEKRDLTQMYNIVLGRKLKLAMPKINSRDSRESREFQSRTP